MKYIRTNYLFGEIISHTKLINGTHLFSIKGLDEILPISEEDFEKCKVADTIEELCDKFVYKKELYKKIEKGEDLENQTIIRLYGITFFDLYIEKWNDIYGAIWTDKGLIFVARMNNEGELELL